MNRLERRAVGRVSFPSKAVVVDCDTEEVYHVDVIDLGPIGVGVKVPAEMPNLVGKDVILVAETLIMYADVVRQTPLEDGSCVMGVAAKRFTNEVLQFLFDSIELKVNEERE